jgi:hypothetical protein
MSSNFAKTFLTTTITSFYSQVETFVQSKNIQIPSISEFLQFIEFEAEAKTEAKKPKRSTVAPTRGKVNSDSGDTKSGESKDSKESESEEKCSFVGSRGGKCKSVAKKDCNGMCKKHFDQSNGLTSGSVPSSERGTAEEKKSRKKTVKTGKGLSSVVSKALEDSDREEEDREVQPQLQTRRTKPFESEKKSKSDSKDSKDSNNNTESKESKPYVPITYNRDSTSYVYDENADDGFVYKKGDYDTVFAVRHRGVAVKPTRVHIEDIKKAGKSVGTLDD